MGIELTTLKVLLCWYLLNGWATTSAQERNRVKKINKQINKQTRQTRREMKERERIDSTIICFWKWNVRSSLFPPSRSVSLSRSWPVTLVRAYVFNKTFHEILFWKKIQNFSPLAGKRKRNFCVEKCQKMEGRGCDKNLASKKVDVSGNQKSTFRWLPNVGHSAN